MKVVAINGSPRRNGNTAKMLREVVKGQDVEFFDLYDMDVRGCSGCLHCKRADGCCIKDDLTDVHRAIREADALVIGSPVYMCEETACTKAFIERTYAFLGNRNPGPGRPDYFSKLPRGKVALALFPCGSPLGGRQFRALRKNYERHFKNLGFEDYSTHIVPGVHPGVDALESPRALKVVARGRKLLER